MIKELSGKKIKVVCDYTLKPKGIKIIDMLGNLKQKRKRESKDK